ncbi:ARS binding protein Abp2 [Rasamsonia emersonii CBS 393.64]|uniref:ARS binding protein Abp2 n=1 Tax=Rasamsonia emersonii (strain ATCC 16479 / CBS 393.64 / IMI 116815) TaxID=1408163 RepID=A0A0F4Z1W5_RASE3|nr:ARS binding protein Abp2 [Rasamsonia emersonii CBS 393.64]KKA23853.1 ARS binding protein Abp2 [Rasamsonia emersonii CBS 393.64]
MPPSAMRSGMSMSPPLFDASGRQRPPRDSLGDTAERRVLPLRELTDETIDDAYVAFILYCNPNVPSSVDTTELRKSFRSPPRSDGKSFSIYTLWELIRKLDRKELKTWIQLAIELGVEPPSLEKMQSTQKVQQYAVRLKRWMRAMHVDAFFEYCLGHPHSYYMRLPSASGPASESRDGVPLEEDLALRALVPEWKPKRGRKRAEDKESEDGQAAKRPHLDTSVGLLDNNPLATHAANFPPSAIPFSAFPDDMDITDPWAAAASSFASDGQGVDPLGGQELRWRSLDREASPAGYPRSAIIPRQHNPADMLATSEPRSAVTPSSRERSRTRRRRGPAVSSAWPSSSGSVTGKVRGRPPNRGSAPGGPFSSFPANPARSNTPGDNASMRSSPAVTADNNQPGPQNNQTQNNQTAGSGRPLTRPSKLQLQVPENTGRPIRLATPPTLLVNGTDEISSGFPPNGRESTGSNVDIDGGQAGRPSLEDVTRMLAGRILHANVVGRSAPIEADEARGLARAAVERLRGMYLGVPLDLVSIICAIFGVGVGQNVRPGSLTVKVANGSSTTTAVENDGSVGQSGGRPTQTYTLTVDRSAPGLRFNSELSELSLSPENGPSKQDEIDALKNGTGADEAAEDFDIPLTDDELDNNNNNNTDGGNDATWKQRYLRLRQTMQKKEAALREYKRNILQAVMADI